MKEIFVNLKQSERIIRTVAMLFFSVASFSIQLDYLMLNGIYLQRRGEVLPGGADVYYGQR